MTINQKQLKHAIQYLHTQKTMIDPLYQYIIGLCKNHLIDYLLLHPEKFNTREQYNKFREQNKARITSDVRELRTGTPGRSINQHLTRHVNQNINRKVDKIQEDPKIPATPQTVANIYNISQQLQHDTKEQYIKTIERETKRIPRKWDKVPSSFKDKLSEYKKEQEKILARDHKRINKNTDNRVKWRQAQMRQGKDRPLYKVWKQTPNPKTRHTKTDKQVVPLDMKFIVVNDKTGDLDYLDHPGDWKGSASNTANCLCELEFTDKEPDMDYETLKEYKLNESEKLKKQYNEAKQKQKEKKEAEKQAKKLKDSTEKLEKQIQKYKENNIKTTETSNTNNRLDASRTKATNNFIDELKEIENKIIATDPTYDPKHPFYSIVEYDGKKYIRFNSDYTRNGRTGNNIPSEVQKRFPELFKDYPYTVKDKIGESIKAYTGADHRLINRTLRKPNEFKNKVSKEEYERIMGHIKNLKQAEIELTNKPRIIQYRGDSKEYIPEKDENGIQKFASFTSTSIDPYVAERWPGDMVWEVIPCDNTKMIPANGKLSKYPHESELLLPSGQRFVTVTKTENNPNNYIVTDKTAVKGKSKVVIRTISEDTYK